MPTREYRDMSYKQRVLLVNKFYYPRGGDCIQMMGVERLLRQHGHEVAVFSMQYPENNPTEYSRYFPEKVDFSGGVKARLAAAARIFGYGGVKARFEKLLRDFTPDVLHLHNIHSYISPVVAEIAKKHKIPVVWTLHDYKPACPAYSCLSGGKPCEKCFSDKTNVLRYRCMKASMAASILAYLEAEVWNIKRLCRSTDTFICPSRFMRQAMIRAGIPSDKLEVLNNFINETEDAPMLQSIVPGEKREEYYCYVGRLSEEKGVSTLIKAAAMLPYKIKIIGTGPLYDYLIKKYQTPNIEFLGFQEHAETLRLLSKARFSVMPSECYENNPLGVIESLCVGTPVVGSDIGGIPELINKTNGKLFTPFHPDSLRQTIEAVHNDTRFDYAKIAEEAQIRFSSGTYYKKIIEIYDRK